MTDERRRELMATFGIRSNISQTDFCSHIEDADFFKEHPDPVLVNGDNGEKVVCISWAKVQEYLQLLDKVRRMSRPGYDPEKEITLKISMDEEMYNQLEIICAQSGYTVAGAAEEFLYWSVNNQGDFRRWIEKCKADGTYDECVKNPLVSVEWER